MEKSNVIRDTKGAIIEMVSYRVKPDHVDTLKDVLEAAREELRAMTGFISHRTMKNAKQPHAFLDVVEWESLEAAESAAAQVVSTAGFKKFGEAVEEVVTFNYFRLYH